ncbi:MFS transporter [Streptomyces sp. NPDC056632]|uniref:MFS transporter n=1 Tax=Streptomyces sp. NPDC056632 TaxID=3345884 RepID=UPI00367D3D3B
MLANVVGVPLGAFAGQLMGWRGPFSILAVLAPAAMVLIARSVPKERRGGQTVSIRSELSPLRSGRLWLVLAACATTSVGVLGTYTYVAPPLTDRAGVAAALVPLVRVGFGAGFLVGGRAGDVRPYATTIKAAASAAVVLLTRGLLSAFAVPTMALVALLGLVAFLGTPVLIALGVRFAGKAPTLGSALTVSAFDLGTAAGSWVTVLALGSPCQVAGPAMVGAAMAALALVPTITSALIQGRRSRPAFG